MKKFILGLSMIALLFGAGFGYAAPTQGPGTAVVNLGPYASKDYQETFVGGQVAKVSIAGTGATDVDVFVYDMNGQLVVQGIGLTDIEIISFVPSYTQSYRIVVENLGGYSNNVILLTD